MNTTGKRIIRFEESGTLVIVATDSGHYDGTQESLNIRRLKDIKEIGFCGVDYKNLKSLSDQIVKTRTGYGDAWGAGSMLFPITQEEEAELVEAAAKDVLATETREKERSKKAEEMYKRLVKNGLCEKCGTFCCGDCE